MSNKFTNFFAMLIFLVLLSSNVFCEDFLNPYQSDSLIKTKWTTEEGLPQNTVSNMIQTQDGYIWLATFGGLVRFDGVKFTVFNPANTPQMPTGRITTLVEDEQKTLWIGTDQGNVITYKDGEFHNFLKDDISEQGSIWGFFVEEKQVWVFGFEKFISYDLEGKIIKNIAARFPPDSSFFSVIKDKNDRVLVSSSIGLMEFSNGDLTFAKINGQTLETPIYKMAINKDGEIIFRQKNSLKKISDGKIETIFEDKNSISTIGAFTISPENEIWLNNKYSLYKITKEKTQKFDISDLINRPVRSMLFDREGNIWVGSNGDGLIRIKNPRVKTYGIFDKNKRLAPVQSIIEDKNGTLWIATDRLLRFENDEFTSYSIKPKGIENPVKTFAVDKQNTLWIGMDFGMWRMKDSVLEKIPNIPKFNVKSLYFDSKGVLWIGTMKLGLHKLENEKLTTYNKEKDGLVNNFVQYINESKDGSLWIGTQSGISRYKDGKFINYTKENGFTDNAARDIYEDSEGVIWIGTYGGGIFRFSDGKFTAITEEQGLAENIVSRILVDDDQNFWMLGNKGVYTVNQKSLNDVADGRINKVICQIYGVNDGMIISEGNGGSQPSGWKASDGKLWFPMIRGGIVIDPKQKSAVKPSVLVEEVTLENKKINKNKQIVIPHDQGNLEIKYTGLSFSKPKQIRFFYKMEELDSEWTDAGFRREAIYRYLPSGKYKFHLKAINADGVWSDESSIIEITVTKPFWQQWWFILLSFLILAGVLFLLYSFRLNHLKNQQLKQQEFSKRLINAHEIERQRIATELHDGLGQNLLLIKNWALLGINDSTENSAAKNHLEEISETATNALDETRTIVKNLRPQNIATFGLTATLTNMIEQIEKSMGVVFETHIDNIDELFSDETEISVYRIVQECLNNIIKHSESPRAKVSIKHFPSKVEIFIQDFGKGFSTSKYFNSENGSKGFGLTSISQRVNLLSGDLVINSAIDEGTTISINLNI